MSTKRHRRILRDNIGGVTKPAILRMAQAAGNERVSGSVYPEVRGNILQFLNKVLKDAVVVQSFGQLKTLKPEHVNFALLKLGKPFVVGKGTTGPELVKTTGASVTRGGAQSIRRKPHRWRPGTVARRNVKKLSKSQKYMIAREPFRRLVREVLQDQRLDELVSSATFDVVQSATENYIIDLLKRAHKVTVNAGRKTLTPADIVTAKYGL